MNKHYWKTNLCPEYTTTPPHMSKHCFWATLSAWKSQIYQRCRIGPQFLLVLIVVALVYNSPRINPFSASVQYSDCLTG